jgi:hypothetical protein
VRGTFRESNSDCSRGDLPALTGSDIIKLCLLPD